MSAYDHCDTDKFVTFTAKLNKDVLNPIGHTSQSESYCLARKGEVVQYTIEACDQDLPAIANVIAGIESGKSFPVGVGRRRVMVSEFKFIGKQTWLNDE
jgi:hypothetical protein